MKKNIYRLLIASAMLMLTACAENSVDYDGTLNNAKSNYSSQSGETTLYATLGNDITKTALSPFDGSWKPLWQEKDEICVFFDESTEGIDFKINKGAGLATASFSGFGSGDKWTAVYPASDAVSINGKDIKILLPKKQTYIEKSFGTNSYPMVAAPTNGILQFKNLCSTIKVQLKGHHVIDSIAFYANDHNISVCGPASVNVDFTDNPHLMMESGGSQNVTLDVGGVMLAPDEITDFYIVLPAQTYKGGFTLKIFTPSGSMTRSTDNNVTLGRSQVHALTPFYVKLDEGLEPSASLEGEGTLSSPMIIKNLSDLITVASSINANSYLYSTSGQKVKAISATYKLDEDINLDTICSETKRSWTPIGRKIPFTGIFDGDGHSIINLYIDTDKSKAGFFGYLAGTLKNLNVYGTVKTANIDAGLVVGYAEAGAIIENCSSHGEISSSYSSGDSRIGGIVGFQNQWTSMYGCSNYASVKGPICIGGIAGESGGELSNSFNYGSIDATNIVGGITGFMYSGSMYNCANFGEVNGNVNCGGIAGGLRNDSEIFNCLNVGDIYANGSGGIGGILGYSFGDNGQTVENCVNVGAVLTSNDFNGSKGGLAGEPSVELKNCYWLYDPDEKQGLKDGSVYGILTSCFGLTKDQINGIKAFTEPLYVNKENTPSLNATDALNNWAFDHLNSHEYWGWTFDEGDNWLSFTQQPATNTQSDVSDIFIISPSELYISYEEYEFEVKVIAGMEHKVSSLPNWISIENTDVTRTGDITTTIYTFKALANPDYSERSGVIVLCNDSNKCVPVNVTQMEKVDESDLWKIKNFYHRSVGFKFTATWCQYCPAMTEEWDYAKEMLEDKFQIAAFHPTSSNLGFDGTPKMESAYRISEYPTGIVDSRAVINEGTYIKQVTEETAKVYGTSSGIEFVSTVSGNTIDLDINLYVHEKGDYKITALLLEDNIISGQQDAERGFLQNFKHDNIVRMAFSAVTGDKFTLSSNNSITSFKYSGSIPSQCNKDNLRILVYVERAYGDKPQVHNISNISYINYTGYYIDNANTAPLGQKAEITFDDGSSKDEKYESKDYSSDGRVTKLQSASRGKGIDIIITGDAFTDKDQKVFETYANRAMEAFFAVEPYNSLRDRFNVWSINAVSKNDFIGGNTKFSVRLGDGTYVEGNADRIFDFTQNMLPSADLTKTVIIVLVNQTVYAGTNFYWPTNEAIAFVPLQTSLAQFDATLRHEAAGHGFGKLDDEYYYDEPAPADWIEGRKEWQNLCYGFWENVDFTNDPGTIRWSSFLNDFHYDGQVGIYQGGGTYISGVWRSTENSIMRYNYGYFNAPSRESIYKKIMRFSEGDGWVYDRQTFVDFDEKGRKEEEAYSYGSNNAYGNNAKKEFVPLHPPVLMTK